MDIRFSVERPIVFLSIKTTGPNPKNDRIISIALNKVDVNGNRKKGVKLIYPDKAISSITEDLSGISNDQLEGKPSFKDIAEDINGFIKGCDLGGYQIENDLVFLMEEFNRCGINFVLYNTKVIDLYRMYKTLHPRTIINAYKEYVSPRNKEEKPIEGGHQTDMCIEILNGMLERNEGLFLDEDIGSTDTGKIQITNSINDIDKTFYPDQLDLKGWFVKNSEGKVIFNKGEYEGNLASDVFLKKETYYKWFIDKASIEDVPRDSRYLAEHILKKTKEALLQ